MDGSGTETIAGLEFSHHDFAVLPGGVTAFFIGEKDAVDSASNLVERAADGKFTTIARLDETTYLGYSSNNYHANALRYYAQDDSYTVSDLAVGISKLNRQGQLQWTTVIHCPEGEARCAGQPEVGNHGHQLLENGNLLVFMASIASQPAPVYELSFVEVDGKRSNSLAWLYTPQKKSVILGDVQRLPNGNTLITYSMDRSIDEVSPAGEVVQSLGSSSTFGYTTFRKTLYGVPQ
jgi:hypothetical protein